MRDFRAYTLCRRTSHLRLFAADLLSCRRRPRETRVHGDDYNVLYNTFFLPRIAASFVGV